MIEDYETIEKPFGNERGNPRYIYFIGNTDYIEDWLKKTEEARQSRNSFLTEDNNDLWDCDEDDDDDDEKNNYSHRDSPYNPLFERNLCLLRYTCL